MRVSIVIPVRDAANLLPACLDQLVQQDYPQELMEVVVVDGMSRDATVRVAREYPLGRISKQVLECPSLGRSQALNMGIRAATGEAICRLDARTRIPSNYISACAQALTATGADNVGGRQVPDSTTPTQIGIGLAMSHPFGAGNAQFRIAKASGFVDTVYLGFFRRSVFDRVGWFDETANIISEDSDMNQRIRETGGKIYLLADLQARYEPRSSLREQSALYYRYGGARAGNILKHRSITAWRQLAAPGLVATLVILMAAAWFSSSAWFLLLFLVGLYLILDGAAALQLAAKANRLDVFPYVFAAFPCMHIGYGFGFWRRILLPESENRHWKG